MINGFTTIKILVRVNLRYGWLIYPESNPFNYVMLKCWYYYCAAIEKDDLIYGAGGRNSSAET
ncbi:MAG: hypothetical protein K9H49_14470 [Bacteroidales bacterium]|nr:hypothetical protein [Bacteroidales bacterium]